MRNDGSVFVFMVLAFFGLALLIAVSYLRHRKQVMLHEERMAALEKGASIPLGPEPAPWSPRAYLLRGLIWSFGGAALIVCLLGIALSTHDRQSPEYNSFRARTVSRNLEIPLDQARQIVEKDQAERGLPPGVSLLGVVPLAVGLAYLVFYFTDDSRKRLTADAPSESFTPRS